MAPSVIAGSSANVKAYVTDLKNRITAEPESSLRTKILESIDFLNIDTNIPANYPGSISLPDGTSISLPDGAAALRWEIPAGGTEYAFVPQTVTTTEAPINSVTRFAYPAELYYYANSNIRTSYSEVSKDYYDQYNVYREDNETIIDWDALLNSKYKGSTTITPDTKAAAIVEPVQYAVARLDATIQAQLPSLTDAKNNSVSITNSSSKPAFPLTGIIVGGQHTVGFDFAPIDNDDANVRFVYDNQVNTNTNYLSTEEKGPTHTLLLQSPEGKDVTVVLEFRNDSDIDFTGVDGIIYKGTKFYLVGQLILDEATGGTDNTRVFTQDQTTKAKLVINGLAKAYNVMPNLLSPRLEIGVTLTTQWEQATPTVVVME